MKKKGFTRGSSTYKCRCCKRLTREVYDEGSIKLCIQCYELAGYENLAMDTDNLSESDLLDIKRMLDELDDLGVFQPETLFDFGHNKIPGV